MGQEVPGTSLSCTSMSQSLITGQGTGNWEAALNGLSTSGIVFPRNGEAKGSTQGTAAPSLTTSYLLTHDSGTNPAQLLHLTTNAQQQAEVHTQCPDVGACLAAHPEDS